MSEIFTNNFFQRILCSYTNDSTVKVLDFIITPGTVAGIFKVKIHYLLNDEQKTTRIIQNDLLNTEAKVYSTVLPEMEKLLRAVGDSTQLGPKLIYQDTKVVVIEDNSDCNPAVDLITDIDQVRLMFRKLAKFHALSIILNETKGLSLTDLSKSHFWLQGLENEQSKMAQYLKPTIHCHLEYMQGWDEFKTYYQKLLGKVDEYCDAAVKCMENRTFKVLNHGWTDIELFRQENTKDLVLINFHNIFWTTPALDLIFLFNQVIHDRLVHEYRSELVQIYSTEFSEILGKLNYSGYIPTLGDLQDTLRAVKYFDLVHLMNAMPEKLDVNPNWREDLLKHFERLDEMGTFEI